MTSLLRLPLRACQNVHTVAGVLKRALIKLEPCLVPEKTFDHLLESITLPPLQVLTLEAHEERNPPAQTPSASGALSALLCAACWPSAIAPAMTCH